MEKEKQIKDILENFETIDLISLYYLVKKELDSRKVDNIIIDKLYK